METIFWIKRIYFCAQGPLENMQRGDSGRRDEYTIGGAYSTYDKAAEALANYVENFEDDNKVEELEEASYITVGYRITETLVDGRIDLPYDRHVHGWAFDNHGHPLDDGLYCNNHFERTFRGRPASKCSFKVGDIVLEEDLGELRFGIVTGTPWTPEKIEEREKELGHSLRMDPSDDSYCVSYDNDGNHSHPHVSHVFPVPFPIEKLEIRDKLRAITYQDTPNPAWFLSDEEIEKGRLDESRIYMEDGEVRVRHIHHDKLIEDMAPHPTECRVFIKDGEVQEIFSEELSKADALDLDILITMSGEAVTKSYFLR